MGCWTITIQGIGAHHNVDNEGDANKITEKFVKELVLAGHNVQSASFTHGGRDELTIPPQGEAT